MAQASPLTPTGEAQQALINQLEELKIQLKTEINQDIHGAYYALNGKGFEVRQKMGGIMGLEMAIEIIKSYFMQRAEQKDPGNN